MNVLIDIKGHANVETEAAVESLRTAVEHIQTEAVRLGFPLVCSFSAPGLGGGIVVGGLGPSSAVCGGPDLTLHVMGTGFAADSVILFNGGAEPTTFVSSAELTTVVKPSLVTVAVTVPVTVVGATASSHTFTFAEAPGLMRAAVVPEKAAPKR